MQQIIVSLSTQLYSVYNYCVYNFSLPQEIKLLFRALGLLQNSQKFTPTPSVTAHSLIMHSITIKINYKLTHPLDSYNT